MRRPAHLALGIDVGTGSVRACFYTTDGRRFGDGVRLPYEWRVTADGGVEVDADAVAALVFAAIDAAVAALPAPPPPVLAVGMSALWHTLLGLGSDGAPATPAYAWGDTRGTATAQRLRERLDEAAVHARTGAMLHPSYPLVRLAWLRESQPALTGRVVHWVSLPEYVWLRLTGVRAVDVSIAAGTGLLDQRTLTWDGDLLDVAGISPAQLSSPVCGPDAATMPPAGSTAADRWPPLRHAVWRLPAGDGACANIGSGCTSAERMALTVGTSAAVRLLLPWPADGPAPPGLWLYRLDTQHAVLGGAISNGGLVRLWLRRTLRLPDDDAQLEALLVAREPAAHGLAMLPFLAGERSPDWPLDATAALAGLRLGTQPLDILQAGIEAVCYRIATLRDALITSTGRTPDIVASGAALERSPWWTGLLADVLGQPLLLSAETEASCRGAAVLALVAAGAIDDIRAARAPGGNVYMPDPERHATHRAAMDRHHQLVRAIARVAH